MYARSIAFLTFLSRNFIDLEDIDDGYNIHVMYVIPADGVDKEYDLNSKISMLLYQIDKWFNSKTKDRLYTDGQNLKFDRKDLEVKSLLLLGGAMDSQLFLRPLSWKQHDQHLIYHTSLFISKANFVRTRSDSSSLKEREVVESEGASSGIS